MIIITLVPCTNRISAFGCIFFVGFSLFCIFISVWPAICFYPDFKESLNFWHLEDTQAFMLCFLTHICQTFFGCLTF